MLTRSGVACICVKFDFKQVKNADDVEYGIPQ